MIRKPISSSANSLLKFMPLLLWLLVILIPISAARIIFDSAVEIENSLYKSRMQQKLRLEQQKYDTSLRPLNFLRNTLESDSAMKILQNWAESDNFAKDYRSHAILGKLSDFFENGEKVTDQFAQLSQQKVGMRPEIIMIIDENEENCSWSIVKPFEQPKNTSLFRKHLSALWLQLKKHNSASSSRSLKQLETSELEHYLGLVDTFKYSYGDFFTRYSFQVDDALYFINLLVPGSITGEGDKHIVAGFCRGGFSPQFMLKKITGEYSNSVFSHKIVMAEEKSLPSFIENDHQMILTDLAPWDFTRLLTKLHLPEGLQPAISISCSRYSPDASYKKDLVELFLKLAAILTLLLPLAIMSGKIKTTATLQKLVRAGFLTGILLPLMASIWLGLCHHNSKKQLETEQMLDFMQQQLALTEQKILLQNSRSILFQNIFADRVGSLPADKIRQLNLTTKYVSKATNRPGIIEASKYMVRRFYSYFCIHPKLENDVVGFGSRQKQTIESLQPVFTSPVRDTLFQLGAYRNIPGDKAQRILQKSQITMGIIDDVIDHKMLSRIFAEERIPIPNSLMTGRENMTCCFWKNSAGEKTGAMFMQSDRKGWQEDVLQLIKEQRLQTVFYQMGYELTLHLYFPSTYRQRELGRSKEEVLARYAPDKDSLWKTAQAIFSVTETARINHLDANPPQLITGQTILDGDGYLMAQATPVSNGLKLSGEAIYAILLLLAMISSYYLAEGVAWLLLRSIPAFQTSVQEMARQNYLWQIELNSGDEFDRLATTFNHLARQMYEKNQISHLVSRNVLDAINSGDDKMLKPGGSRVTASILFADIRSFTTLTEKHPPEQIVSMLNDYFSLMAEEIEKRGGIIDKLIGDAIQAVFYHHECENGAEAAAKAGLAMRNVLVALNQQRRQQSLFTIDNGVGICTGSVICGRVGSEQGKLDATIVGSLAGRAARLESMSKFGSSSKVFIDRTTATMLNKTFIYCPLQSDPEVLEISAG